MIWVLAFIVLIGAGIIWRLAVVAAFWAAIFFVTHLGIVTWTLAHPWRAVLYVAGYFLIGAAWSIAKWWFAETNRVRRAREIFNLGGTRAKSWAEYAEQQKTKVSYHKDDILLWITFWPLNGVWTLLNDPVRRAARRIYDELQGIYQRITDKVWK
jgi:hypothetical protein